MAAPRAARAAEVVEPKGPAAYAAEFVGTLILVVAITSIVSAGAPRGAVLTDVALVHVLALLLLVAAIGSISGAHVNPAVTLAMLAIRKITPRDAGIYVAVQAAGGVAGALLTRMFYSGRGDAVNYGAPAVSEAYLSGGDVFLALLAEALGAFILVWAIMGTAVNPNAPKGVAPLAIGGALGLAVFMFGPATGGSFNPARWFGPALVSGSFTDFWLYIIGPVAGAVLAAVGYRALLERERLPAQTPRRGESAEPPAGA